MEIEAKPDSPSSSRPVAKMSFLENGKETPAPGCQRLFYFNIQTLAIQAMSTSQFETSPDAMSDWLINLVVERSKDFLDYDCSALNEFVSMSMEKRLDLLERMAPTTSLLISEVRRLCMSIHIVELSIQYDKMEARWISPEDVADLWSRRVLFEVMEI